MRTPKAVLALVSSSLLLVGCGQPNGAGDSMGTKQAYSLCPKTDDAKQRLYELVRGFAHRQKARLIDRGAGATRELNQLNSEVLKNTGGEVILLTVEKPDEFRISVTNLGLKEKVGLAIRIWGENGENSSIASFMDDLARFWTIQKVEGGITDDPPC